MALLEVRGLCKRFGGLQAVRDVNFVVEQGEIVGLIGANGAGKTTTFNLLVGLSTPTSGHVVFDGREIGGMKPHRIARMGMTKTFQTIALFDDLSLVDNVIVGALCRTQSVRKARLLAADALEMAGLDPDRGLKAGDLTMGDRARLEVARALATGPKLLLLDEVMVGLNASETNEAMASIRRMRDRGITVVVVEHNMRAIMALSDRVIAFEHGECIADGTPADVAAHPRVIESYLGKGASAAAH